MLLIYALLNRRNKLKSISLLLLILCLLLYSCSGAYKSSTEGFYLARAIDTLMLNDFYIINIKDSKGDSIFLLSSKRNNIDSCLFKQYKPVQNKKNINCS